MNEESDGKRVSAPQAGSTGEWDKRYEARRTPWCPGSPCSELARRLVDLNLSPCRVLDVGCGTGINSIDLARRGFSVVGIDLSATAVSLALRNVPSGDVKVDFRVASICDAEDGLGTFDFVFDRGCYHFVRQYDRERYLRAIFRLMKPGGILLLLVGNSNERERWGPPRMTASELVGEFSALFDLRDLHEFRFDAPPAHPRPLGWSSLWSRRDRPRIIAPSPAVHTQVPTREGGAREHTLTFDTPHQEHSDLRVETNSFLDRLRAVLSDVVWSPSCAGQAMLDVNAGSSGLADLFVTFRAKDRDSGAERPIHYRRTGAFSPAMTRGEVLQVVVANLAVVAVHEMLEQTLVAGERLFDPHDAWRLLDLRYAEALVGATGATPGTGSRTRASGLPTA